MTHDYKVLARKYRPETFADLIGQEAMVRTLRRAFETGRIAQAFILTGIRGTGKTTTARIVAKGLNCIGKDGNGGPTVEPCGVCEPCVAIAEGRHVDVQEMDAASNTGVDDVREIIEGVRYRAASARYKVYIVDEVHMLSTSAFNALLKTLEEPPEHVKFIFATTEIRKVPVTVLSRCQRFDLRRIEPEVMMAHLSSIAAKEDATVDDAATALIARAAEGSVRDALSILDQAIAMSGGTVEADAVRDMLGLADRARVLDLFEAIMRGQAAEALEELGRQYSDGADPLAVLRDLAEITHWVSVLQVTPDAADDPTVAPEERARGQAFAQGLPKRSLARAWQMLLKALEEVAQAPTPMMAAEMAVIRLTHVADLPSPDDLIRKLRDAPAPTAAAPAPTPAPSGGGVRAVAGGGVVSAQGEAQQQALARFGTWASVMELIRANRDIPLLTAVEQGVRLAAYAPGRIEFELAPGAAEDLPSRLQQRLQTWTGARWGVSVVSGGGAPTVAEVASAERDAVAAEAMEHPLTQAVMQAFPGAKVVEVRARAAEEAQAALDALEEAEEVDPFEED
ncbi:DNA polymerase III subunit gamma/tau [Jannaschia sp. Os4]|uniref:DNA polymerase III subunit gamma/tau n=1 Tax=Jannaschia sp. Os4 TaxID=2807617 RepID=UPI001939CA80|nr:DNA polymerase III subunit gamma/tau [Jannaschia sp. Os4]MBM2574982.1 DNA polymerase III subunit gamma/tau [Jannaschia sp. Os4]